MSSPHIRLLPALLAATLSCTFFCATAPAQDSGKSGFDMSVHANDSASAADIGLPAYPGAVPAHDKDKDDDSNSADVGFSFGDFHFKLLVASFRSSDPPAEVLAFYRKPLSKYGDVLECIHGKPVGSLTVTHSGLTCSDKKDANGGSKGISSDGHELRAGTPLRFRVVGIDDETRAGSTKFALIYMELPKDNANRTN